jgi:poly(A) polymerase Pap1
MPNKKHSANSNVDDLIDMLRKYKDEKEAKELLMRILLEHPEKRLDMDDELWKKKTNPSKRKNE